MGLHRADSVVPFPGNLFGGVAFGQEEKDLIVMADGIAVRSRWPWE
jgi:hypothetical protein